MTNLRSAPAVHRVAGTEPTECTGPLESIRAGELELVRGYFQEGTRVLEIGGGSGFQASAIASWNCRILSIDLPSTNSSAARYYPVARYDGVNMPVRSGSVDIV